MKKLLAVAVVAAGVVALPSVGQAEGNLAAAPATRLDLAITGAGATLSQNSFDVETGKYYRLTITSDGGAEVLFLAPELFQNIWMNQIVAGGVEIKLWGAAAGVAGIEIGEGGAMEVAITFVAVRPGEYAFTLDGVEGVGGTFIVH